MDNPEVLGLQVCAPRDTYLDDYDRVWIGSKWDIGEKYHAFSVYRKGNYVLTVRKLATACVIIEDDLAPYPSQVNPSAVPSITAAAPIGPES